MLEDESRSTGRTNPFHRTVPPLIGALSVVRHQVYWYSGSSQDEGTDRGLPSIADIEKATWRRSSKRKGWFKEFAFSQDQPNDRMKYIYVWWKGMLTHVRVQKHTEYIAVLTSINLSRNMEIDEEFQTDDQLMLYNRKAGCISERASVDKWLTDLGNVGPEQEDKTAALNGLLGPLSAKQCKGTLFADFDADFDMEALRGLVIPARIARAAGASRSTDDAAPADLPGAAGKPGPDDPEMIIDFRGLVTSAPAHEVVDGNELFRRCFTDEARPVRETSHLLAETDQEAIKREAAVLSAGGRDPWFLRNIGDYWRAVQPDGTVKHEEAIEFSATGLLDGRALFITHQALPPTTRVKSATGAPAPLSPIRFFLHCRRSDERQIGRVVDRLCTMATVRAALERHAADILGKRRHLRELLGSIEKSLDGLIFQNHILNTIILKQRDENETAGLQRELEDQVRLMDASASGAIDYFTKFSNRKPVKDQSSRDVLRALSSGMNALERAIQKQLQLSPKDKQENLWGADDYMEYKVERATYYFDRFSRLEDHIRIARVEGFQTYPELVKRRMQDAFGYVRNAKEYLREIANQRTRMSNQISNITQIVEAHESDEEQRKIAEIQDFAEFALLTFLLPYYFGYMLNEILLKLGWVSNKYAVFFWLIILFTGINLIKRLVEGKLAMVFWVPPKKGLRAILAFLSSINFLSLAAIAAAFFLLDKLSELPSQAGDPDKTIVAKVTEAKASPDPDAASSKAPGPSNSPRTDGSQR